MYKNLLFLLILNVLLFSACKDEQPFENVTYICECGSTSWNGASYQLTDAHWIVTATDTTELGLPIITGKDYYATTKIEVEGEEEAHHLNMRVNIPDVTEGVQAFIGGSRFFEAHPDSNSVEILIEEVDFNSLAEVTEYKVLAGDFTLSESGSIDALNFNLEIYPTINGSASGASFPWSISMISAQEDIEE